MRRAYLILTTPNLGKFYLEPFCMMRRFVNLSKMVPRS